MKKWRDIDGWFLEDQGVMLQKLAVDKTCIEIGSHKGRSAICMAEVASHVYTIDIKEWSGFKDNIIGYPITSFIASSVDGSDLFTRDNVSLVFIDGSHLCHDVILDILSWWDKLKPNGIMIFHDYGTPGHDGVKRAVDEVFGSDMLIRDYSLVWIVKNAESSRQIYRYKIHNLFKYFIFTFSYCDVDKLSVLVFHKDGTRVHPLEESPAYQYLIGGDEIAYLKYHTLVEKQTLLKSEHTLIRFKNLIVALKNKDPKDIDPILIDADYTIWDGQHRAAFFKYLKYAQIKVMKMYKREE